MAKGRTVVVQGGGKNLYKVTESAGWYHAYQVHVGPFTDSLKSIGKARSFPDALDLIRSHSGKDIDKIKD